MVNWPSNLVQMTMKQLGEGPIFFLNHLLSKILFDLLNIPFHLESYNEATEQREKRLGLRFTYTYLLKPGLAKLLIVLWVSINWLIHLPENNLLLKLINISIINRNYIDNRIYFIQLHGCKNSNQGCI